MEQIVGVFCLHGFLGTPEDFKPIATKVSQGAESLRLRFHAPALLQNSDIGIKLQPNLDLNSWAKNFLNYVRSKSYEKNILVGYSMGGRLALNAILADASGLFDGALLLSTNLGVLTDAEKQIRFKSDMQWAQRFLSEDWMSLISSWNQQAVFHHEGRKMPVIRLEKDYDRQLLAQALRNWSLSKHELSFEKLRELKPQCIWAVGDLDTKYKQLQDQMQKEKVPGQKVKIPHSGHRLLVEAPEECADLLSQLIDKL